MDICYYYQILDIGILYEKGRKSGRVWKIGERKRLIDEVSFWKRILEYIELEENGIDCSQKAFSDMERMCKKYYFPNYKRISEKSENIINDKCIYNIKNEEKQKIHMLLKKLLNDVDFELNRKRNKEESYRVLSVAHNLPRAMHGCNKLNEKSNSVTCEDALTYTYNCMDDNMKNKYARYFE